jgi:RimJ/RimL family protein N-acetyltransferase
MQIPDLVLYAIVDKADGNRRAAGLYFLLHINPAFGTCEIGLIYGPRLARRPGGTEAFLLLARYVFASGYRRVEWRCASTHIRSQQAASRFGFKFEGLLRQTMWLKGRNWDTMLYAMIDSDWPAIEARLTAWLSPDNFRPDGRQIRALSSL